MGNLNKYSFICIFSKFHNLKSRFLHLLYTPYPAAPATSSVTGYAIHTPLIPHSAAIKKDSGTIRTSPLRIESTWAGSTLSADVKNVAKIILYPANGADRK